MISLSHLILFGLFLFNHISFPGSDHSNQNYEPSSELQKPQASPESPEVDAGSVEKLEVLKAVHLDTAIYLFEKLDAELRI